MELSSASFLQAEKALDAPPKPVTKQAKASAQIVGVLKGIVDEYLAKFKKEKAEWKKKSEDMQKVIDSMEDAEGKESAVDEKLKMKESHEKKLQDFASFIASVDASLKAIAGEGAPDWKDEFPDAKKEIEGIFEEFPDVQAEADLLSIKKIISRK